MLMNNHAQALFVLYSRLCTDKAEYDICTAHVRTYDSQINS